MYLVFSRSPVKVIEGDSDVYVSCIFPQARWKLWCVIQVSMCLVFSHMPGESYDGWIRCLCTLYFLACQVKVIVDDSGVCVPFFSHARWTLWRVIQVSVYLVFSNMSGNCYSGWIRSLCTLYFLAFQLIVIVGDSGVCVPCIFSHARWKLWWVIQMFMHLIFYHMPGESYDGYHMPGDSYSGWLRCLCTLYFLVFQVMVMVVDLGVYVPCIFFVFHLIVTVGDLGVCVPCMFSRAR